MERTGQVEMSNFIYLIENYTLPTLLVSITFLFLAIKEICEAVSWIKDRLNSYHNKRNQSEEEKESIEDRLQKLEKHDNWQYNALLEMTKSLQSINTTLSDMQKKQEEATVATARSTLYRLSQEILEKGYMSQIEYDCFKELYDVYIENHGNHSMKDKIAPEVFKLEIRN